MARQAGLVILVGAAIAVSAGKAPAAAASPVPVDTGAVIVTATRHASPLKNSPGINYVINRRAIEATSPTTTSDVLGYVQGIDVEAGTGVGSPSKKSISINGTPAFHNIILVDGKRLLSSHFHTGIDVNLVPPGNIERIEVVKDASGALYGSDAIGGVVNIITKAGRQEPSLAFSSSAGSQNTWKSGLSLLGSTAKKVGYSAYADWEQSDGLPIEASRRAGKLNYRQFSLMDRVDAPIGDRVSLSTFVHYVSQHDMENPSDTLKYDAALFSPGVNLTAGLTDNLSLSSQTYYTRWVADLSSEKNELATPQVWLTWNGFRAHTLLLGGEAQWRNFARTGVAEKEQKAAAAFVQDEYTVAKNLTVMAAGRLDYVFNAAYGGKTVGPIVTPKLSVLYRPVEPVAIRVNGGFGFRAPNVQDLYESRSHSGIWRYGNSGLKPEYSRTLGLGVEVSPANRWSVMANGFHTSLADMIAIVNSGRDTLYQGKNVRIWARENIRSYTIRSFELSGRYCLPHFTMELGGSATWQEQGDAGGKDVLLFPGQNLRCKVSGNYPATGPVAANGFIGLKGSFNRTSPGGTALSDYKDLEAGIGCTFSRNYSIYFKAQNLLGEKIDLYEDALITVKGVRRFEGGVKISVF